MSQAGLRFLAGGALLLVAGQIIGCSGSVEPEQPPVPSATPTVTATSSTEVTPRDLAEERDTITVVPSAMPAPKPFTAPTLIGVPSPIQIPTQEIVVLDGLPGDAVVPALPEPFAMPVHDPTLEMLIIQTIEDSLADHDSDEPLPSYSVVVHNLADGRSAAVNDDQVYYSASLFKMGLLLEAYRQRDAGELDFSDGITLEESHTEHDYGTLEILGLEVGDTISISDAVRAMIIISDTPTAIMMQELLGPLRVDAAYRELGLQDMRYVVDLPTSARDMAVLLKAIARGHEVTNESRLEMLSLLLQEWFRDGIHAGLPPGTPAAHKTGNWNKATHDAALVWGPSGPYVIVVLSDQSWEWGPTVALSRAVFDYFAGSTEEMAEDDPDG